MQKKTSAWRYQQYNADMNTWCTISDLVNILEVQKQLNLTKNLHVKNLQIGRPYKTHTNIQLTPISDFVLFLANLILSDWTSYVCGFIKVARTVVPRFFEHNVFRIPRFFELFPWSLGFAL